MYYCILKYIEYDKIDVIFEHQPQIFKINYDDTDGFRYLSTKINFHTIFFSRKRTINCKALYVFLKIIQSMNLHMIRSTKIFFDQGDLNDFNEEHHNNIQTHHVSIYANDLLNYIEFKYFYEYGCFPFGYFSKRLLIMNEIERKQKLSDIVFEKLKSF